MPAPAQTVAVMLGARNGLPNDKSRGAQQYSFKFDSILHNAPQAAVYEVRRARMRARTAR